MFMLKSLMIKASGRCTQNRCLPRVALVKLNLRFETNDWQKKNQSFKFCLDLKIFSIGTAYHILLASDFHIFMSSHVDRL